jgi:hypothetical protein
VLVLLLLLLLLLLLDMARLDSSASAALPECSRCCLWVPPATIAEHLFIMSKSRL